MPVNIHRANVLWYNKKVFADNNLMPPKTWDEFFKVADALKAKGIVPFVIGTKEGWEAGHTFETDPDRARWARTATRSVDGQDAVDRSQGDGGARTPSRR